MGYAYRMSNVPAAIGLAQLRRLDEMIDRTRELNARYVDELADIDGVHIASPNSYGRGNCWLTVVYLDEAHHPTPHEVCKELSEQGIECRPTWKPMHLQPLYRDSEIAGGAVAEQQYRRGLCLPSGSGLTDDDQSRVIDALRTALAADRIAEMVDLDEARKNVDQKLDSSATSEQSDDHPTPA
jgi:dTDP-4-amino-4,6-dideoxygalactose transaminase